MTTKTMSNVPPTVEECLTDWAEKAKKNSGVLMTLPPGEAQFIEDMRKAAATGMGYGAMQQIIEWEWRRQLVLKWGTDPDGALGPLHTSKFHLSKLDEQEKEIERLKAEVKRLKG